jgi:hypothetical protein
VRKDNDTLGLSFVEGNEGGRQATVMEETVSKKQWAMMANSTLIYTLADLGIRVADGEMIPSPTAPHVRKEVMRQSSMRRILSGSWGQTAGIVRDHKPGPSVMARNDGRLVVSCICGQWAFIMEELDAAVCPGCFRLYLRTLTHVIADSIPAEPEPMGPQLP